MARKLNTRHADDAVLDSSKGIPCAIAMLDDELYWHHSVSQMLTLQFVGSDLTMTFDQDTPGKLPDGWSIRQTRPTKALATWQVTPDSTAPSMPHVLALTKTENYGETFNLAIDENTSFKDLDLTVKVKGVRGEEDQGGGPIWRCRDENNYYICPLNP